MHFEAQVRLEVRRPDDAVAGTMNLSNMYALPGALAVQGVTLPVLPDGRYVVLVFVDYGAADLLAGQLEIAIP